MDIASLPTIKFGTGWVDLEVIAGVDVALTVKGYAPVLAVRNPRSGLEYRMFISAKSLASTLETLRKANGGGFVGLRLRVRKQSNEPLAQYEVEVP